MNQEIDIVKSTIDVLGANIQDKPAPLAKYVMDFALRLRAKIERGVSTAAEAEALAEETREIKKLKDSCDEEKKAITTPLTRMVRSWSARWKPAVDALDEVERLGKKTVLAFQLQAQEKAAEALRASTDPEALQEVVDAVTLNAMDSRDAWRGHIVSRNLVPARFWKIDTAAIDTEIQKAKGAVAIPGVLNVCDKIAVMPRSKR